MAAGLARTVAEQSNNSSENIFENLCSFLLYKNTYWLFSFFSSLHEQHEPSYQRTVPHVCLECASFKGILFCKNNNGSLLSVKSKIKDLFQFLQFSKDNNFLNKSVIYFLALKKTYFLIFFEQF